MNRRKVAAITGGGTGIGLASAMALAEAGFDVLIAGRREPVLAEARRELIQAHPDCSVATLAADVGVPEQASAVARRTVHELGHLDVMVTAASAFEPVAILDMSLEQWDATINVSLRGTFLCAAEAARHMKDHGGGRIVLFASANCVQSEFEVAHYDAAKSGVKSLTHSMAIEFAPHGIIVNAVAPGWVRTAMSEAAILQAPPGFFRRVNPLGRWAEPSEVGSLVRYLATDSPGFLTGEMILIDGGQTIMAPTP